MCGMPFWVAGAVFGTLFCLQLPLPALARLREVRCYWVMLQLVTLDPTPPLPSTLSALSLPYTEHFTVHCPHSTLHTLHFTLHTPHFTLYTPHFTLHTLHSTLYTFHSTLFTPHFTLHTFTKASRTSWQVVFCERSERIGVLGRCCRTGHFSSLVVFRV